MSGKVVVPPMDQMLYLVRGTKNHFFAEVIFCLVTMGPIVSTDNSIAPKRLQKGLGNELS